MRNRSLRKRIKKLEDIIAPKPEDDRILVGNCGPSDEPHGKYGYRKYHIDTGEVEACTEEEESEFLRATYLSVPRKIRKRFPGWSNFKRFKEGHRCKCNLHDKSEILGEEFFKRSLQAILTNFIKSMERDIYALIREGKIQKTEDVDKILSLFDDEKDPIITRV